MTNDVTTLSKSHKKFQALIKHATGVETPWLSNTLSSTVNNCCVELDPPQCVKFKG